MASFAFRPEAEAEIAQAVDWYETRRPGLGAEFLHALDEALARLALNPKSYTEIMPGVRRTVLRRFPYSVIYQWSEMRGEILIVACFHGARDPVHSRERLPP